MEWSQAFEILSCGFKVLISFRWFLLADNMEKILITIRVRPLSKVEAVNGSPWQFGSNSIVLCDLTGAPVSGQCYAFGNCFYPFSFSRGEGRGFF